METSIDAFSNLWKLPFYSLDQFLNENIRPDIDHDDKSDDKLEDEF